MATYIRCQVKLTGWPGAPGVNTLSFIPGDTILDFGDEVEEILGLLQAVYTGMKQGWVQGVTAHSPTHFEARDVTTNELLEVYAAGEDWTVSGGTQSSTSRATMAKARFVTDGIRRNRLVQGGPYIGPIAGVAITTTGELAQSYRDEIAGAWDGLMDALPLGARLAVYSQPAKATTKWPEIGGMVSHVQTVAVMTLPAVLRSRRD